MNLSLSKYIINELKKNKEKEYLTFLENKYTYGDIDKLSNVYAKGLLALGIKPKQHLAIIAPNSDEWVLIQIACLKLGVVLVMINNSCQEKELSYMLNHSDSCALITTKNIMKINKLKTNINVFYIEELKTLLTKKSELISDDVLNKCIDDIKPDDILTMQYTSGTTGHPKGVLIKGSAMLTNILQINKNYEYNKDDKILLASPLYHVMGSIVTVLVALVSGSSIVLMERFKTKEVLNLIEKEKVTTFHGVPTMYQYMVLEHHNYDISSLKNGLIGAANCTNVVKKQIIDELKIDNLLNVYGQTETLLVCQILRKDSLEKKLTTCGKSYEDVTIKIINPITKQEVSPNEEGELIVKTSTAMAGYYKNIEATEKTIVDGWVHTGDVASMDEDGYITIKNRIKEIIIRGGENISPLEIEETLITHPSVKDVSIVGVHDNFLGEEIAALIILKEEINSKSELKNELHQYMLNNLARHKNPKYIEFVDKFHATGSGKIQKFKQREYIEKIYNLA